MAQVQVRDKLNEPIILVNIRLGINGQSLDESYDDKFTDYAGNTAWPNPLPSNSGYDLFVNYRNILDEYESITVHVPSLEFDVLIILEKLIKPVQDIHIFDNKFYDEDNQEWKMCFGSNFLLPQLVAEGIDIVPFLYDGLNGYRMFASSYNPAMQAGFKPFHPNTYPNWLNAIGDTLTILNANGLAGQLDIICDAQYPNMSQDLSVLRKMVSDCNDLLNAHKGFLGSLGNENFKNGFNANDFTEPIGKTIWACGSGGSGDPAPTSNGRVWRSQRQHLRRDKKLYIDIPPIDAPTYHLNPMILFDETVGYADFDNGSSRTNDSEQAYRMGRIMSAFWGGVIHLHSGGHSRLLGQIEEVCKDRFVESFNE